MNEVIKETKEKLDMEKQAAESAKKELELGNITQGEYDALQAEIVTTTNELSNLEKQARQASSVLGSQMQAAGAHIKEVGNNISELGEKITGVGDKVSALGGKMTATITMPVVAGGTAAVKEATDYSSALAKLSTIADTTQTPIDDLDSSIMALSDSTGMGADGDCGSIVSGNFRRSVDQGCCWICRTGERACKGRIYKHVDRNRHTDHSVECIWTVSRSGIKCV